MYAHANAADEEERPSTPKAQENLQQQNQVPAHGNNNAASLELATGKAAFPTEKLLCTEELLCTEKLQCDELRISFDSVALELCARRVAAESGDVRKSLEACRLAAQTAAQQVCMQGCCVYVREC
jgi:hypothetical protein